MISPYPYDQLILARTACQRYYTFSKRLSAMLPEQENSRINSIRALHEKKEGSVLLLCSGSGRIVFVYGDPAVFEMKLTKMLQRNVFQLGFSLMSLMQIARNFPNGLLAQSREKMLPMELISRSHIHMKQGIDWQLSKQSSMKGLSLNCSLMKVSFSDRIMEHKISEVYKVSQPEITDEKDVELVLIEAKTLPQYEITTHQLDYDYVRRQVLKEIELNDLT